jgi:hypothetical protein
VVQASSLPETTRQAVVGIERVHRLGGVADDDEQLVHVTAFSPGAA